MLTVHGTCRRTVYGICCLSVRGWSVFAFTVYGRTVYARWVYGRALSRVQPCPGLMVNNFKFRSSERAGGARSSLILFPIIAEGDKPASSYQPTPGEANCAFGIAGHSRESRFRRRQYAL